MPVYVYGCNKCGHSFEELHKIDDRAMPCDNPCPECTVTGEVAIVLSAAVFGATHKSTRRIAGKGWEEVLRAKKKGAGKRTTIKD
jgi:putative FmdB family regulatory protein